jgi:hypothetical protein
MVKSTIVSATRKYNFLKCVHFQPARTFTGNIAVLGVLGVGQWSDRLTPQEVQAAAPTLFCQIKCKVAHVLI